MYRRALTLGFSCLVFVVPSRADKRAFTIEDLYRVRTLAHLQISPDGATVAFTAATNDLPHAKHTEHIWLMNANGTNARQFTHGDAGETSPVFSPDGKWIAFVSSRDGSSNIYIIPSGGGEASQLTHLSTGVSDPLWSPDGKWIVFSSDVYPECGADDPCNKKISDRWSKGPLQAHMADGLLYRHWTDVERRHAHAHSDRRCGKRRRARFDSRQFRIADVSACGASAVRFLAGQLRTCVRLGSRRRSCIFDERRRLDRSRRRRRPGQKHHRFKSCLRRHAAIFSRRQVHRLPHAEAAGLRVGSLSPSRLTIVLRERRACLRNLFVIGCRITSGLRIRSRFISTRRLKATFPCSRYRSIPAVFARSLSDDSIDEFGVGRDARKIIFIHRSTGEPAELFSAEICFCKVLHSQTPLAFQRQGDGRR